MQAVTAHIAPLNSMRCFCIRWWFLCGQGVQRSTDDGEGDRTAIVPFLASRSASQRSLGGMYVTTGIVSCFHRCILTTLCSNEIVGVQYSSLLSGRWPCERVEHLQHSEQKLGAYVGICSVWSFLDAWRTWVCAGASKAKTLHSLRNP